MPRNVGTFLWRTLYLQGVRRHYIATVMEIAVVASLYGTLVYSWSRPTPLSKDSDEVDARLALVPTNVSHIVYGPKNDYNDELMLAVAGEIVSRLKTQKADDVLQDRPTGLLIGRRQSGVHIAFSSIGAHAITDGEHTDGEHADGEHADDEPVDDEHVDKTRPRSEPAELVAQTDAKAVAKKCEELLKPSVEMSSEANRAPRPTPLCLALSETTSESPNLSMTLYAPVDSITEEMAKFDLGSFRDTGGAIGTATVFQHIIEQEHLKLQSKAHPEPQVNYMVSIGVMPGWPFKGVENQYEDRLIVVITLVAMIVLIRRINAIQYEFSTGTAEHQGVLGLSDTEFFWGHFLNALIIGLIESAIAILVMYLATHKGTTYVQGVDPTLLVVSFIIAQIGYSMLVILITWVFPKGWVAIITVIMILTVLPEVIAKSAGSHPLPKYFLSSRMEKLSASILPQCGFIMVMRIICIARDYEGGATWSLVTKPALGKDTVTILGIWAVMLITDVVFAFLAWYLSNVLSWSTENPQHPLFCLSPSYWMPEADGTTAEKMKANQDPSRFEELPPETKTVITTSNLTKVFGYKPALNGVNMKVYESKITVLLGHNGAGKTTLMSILTGMKAPTSGVAKVCGYNVTKHRYQVRKLVSLCQQTDIFFDDMTCAENVLYFGSLKGGDTARLKKAILETLRVVGLEDKAYSMPRELSGGMKRRLSIAITLVSEPKLLILDEPSAGLDPETRRNVWDTLQSVAKKSTLLLSSHDMEEADAIADQIIVMAAGVTVCSGSTAFLKKACGVGYKVTFTKVPKAFKLDEAMAIIQKTTPLALVDDDKKEQVSITLGTMDPTGFPAMFHELEKSLKKLGIASIGVTVASMKDVYLKINFDWAPGGKGREDPVEEEDIDAVCKAVTKQRTASRSFCALFIKRLLSLLRSWDLYLIFFLLPLGLHALLTWQAPPPGAVKAFRSGKSSLDIPIKLGVHFPDTEVVLGESPATNVSEKLRALVESESCSVRSTRDLRKELHEIMERDFPTYIKTYPMAVAFNATAIRMIPNPTSAMALPVLVNLVYTAWLRVLTSKPMANINATVTYLKIKNVHPMQQIFTTKFFSLLYWLMAPAMTYSLAFGAYGSFPAAERLSGARDVQLMTGISGLEFIFAHFVFDFIYHVLFCVLWCAILFSLSSYSAATFGLLMLAFVSLAPEMIGFAYLFAENAESPGSAVTRIFLALYIGGAVATIVSWIARAFVDSNWVHYATLTLPPYAIVSLLSKISSNEDKSRQCKLLESYPNLLKVYGVDCKSSVLALTYGEAGIELLTIIVEGLVFMAIMVFLTSGYLMPGGSMPGQESSGDEDVEGEKNLVNAARGAGDFTNYSMLVWSLHKRFGTLVAVRGTYMALRPSECFGLLGVNGAGKTTTFQMLAALVSVSHGDASTSTAKLSGRARTWQSQISYCFQLGGLLDRLNSYEYLYLIGRLRGIPEGELKPMIDSILSVADLTEHASKECGVYSGGNRRKLSIGAALLGLPPFIFLDEPYAGVDVVSRNKIFRAIAEIKKRSRTTFVLTSHNMDECEFSCDRLTIMVQGRMMCLGTVQHLREKFGQGYRLEFLLKHTAVASTPMLKQAVEHNFAGIQLKDDHQNLLCYHLANRIPWSKLFTKVLHLQKNFELEHALVGENTLQDIFLNFAKTQEAHVKPAASATASGTASEAASRRASGAASGAGSGPGSGAGSGTGSGAGSGGGSGGGSGSMA
ncbi:phospholipid-transporting ATPase ABCA3-like [Dermacentor albipictus]|uniref:phospholipid-transporting ATPase ABCA3-like n=1 Tax=Dermacentor albipictus TaxID=60249 RepID=UPI0031FBE25D